MRKRKNLFKKLLYEGRLYVIPKNELGCVGGFFGGFLGFGFWWAVLVGGVARWGFFSWTGLCWVGGGFWGLAAVISQELLFSYGVFPLVNEKESLQTLALLNSQ